MRLDAFVFKSGVTPRKKARIFIRSQQVTVNDEIIKNISYSVRETDVVCVDGKAINISENLNRYYMMHKPINVLSDKNFDKGFPCYSDFLLGVENSLELHACGRLDASSTGLLLLTDDGEFNHRISHPKRKISKVYIVKAKNRLDEVAIEVVRSGMKLYDGTTIKPADIEEISDKVYKITLTEGKTHIIKKIFKTFSNWVEELKRTEIGPLKMDETLKPGQFRELTPEEIKEIKDIVSMA